MSYTGHIDLDQQYYYSAKHALDCIKQMNMCVPVRQAIDITPVLSTHISEAEQPPLLVAHGFKATNENNNYKE